MNVCLSTPRSVGFLVYIDKFLNIKQQQQTQEPCRDEWRLSQGFSPFPVAARTWAISENWLHKGYTVLFDYILICIYIYMQIHDNDGMFCVKKWICHFDHILSEANMTSSPRLDTLRSWRNLLPTGGVRIFWCVGSKKRARGRARSPLPLLGRCCHRIHRPISRRGIGSNQTKRPQNYDERG